MKLKRTISQEHTIKYITRQKIEVALDYLLMKAMLDDDVENITILEKLFSNLTKLSPNIWREKMEIQRNYL